MLAASSGCTWLRRWNLVQEPPPQVLPPGAGLEQVIAAVNRNNSQIQALFSNSASLSGPGFPTLHAHLAYQRPRNFRLKAEIGYWPEIDLGSNDERFWFWIKRNQPPAVYFCRHDQYPTSRARQMIPIDPNWLIEALGTLELNPALPYQEPIRDKDNRIVIRAMQETPEGPIWRVTIIDAVSAWVMEQQIIDARDNKLRARSIAEGYHPDPRTGLFVPSVVRVECPEAGFSMRIDLGAVQVNQLQGNPAELWSMPSYPRFPPVDLGNPNLSYGPPPGMPAGR